MKNDENVKMMATVVDLFCGAGGLSKGFEQAGFKVVFASDIWKDAIETYALNNKEVHVSITDVKKLKANDILKQAKLKSGMIDVVIGGTPCQGFSLAGSIGREGKFDERNSLFLEFVRIVNELKPKFFVMENVASITRHEHGKTVSDIKNCFESIGYKTDSKILNAVNYGVPQYRNRIFFMGNRLGVENVFPEPSLNRKTVLDAIGDLPRLKNGEKHNVIPNHEAMFHTEQMLKKMQYVKDGGDRTQIPEKFRPKKGDARKYIRYCSNSPSICITGDMRKVFHYSQNRALTVRELARLQTFPDSYRFAGSRISQQLQVGNSVPPLLAKAVAKEILNKIFTYRGNYGYNLVIQKISNNKLHRK
jgi:DNA (cytosine-5)-methyltransferase 1